MITKIVIAAYVMPFEKNKNLWKMYWLEPNFINEYD